MTEDPEHITPLPSTHVDNGILARVPGQYIAQACNSLPDPAATSDGEMRVEVDAGWIGRVRLTFEKRQYRRPRGKFSAVAWSCKHAEPVADAGGTTGSLRGLEEDQRCAG